MTPFSPQNAVSLWPLEHIITNGVMTLDESMTLIAEEIEFAFDVWYHHQSQIVGFYPLSHSRNEVMNKWCLSSELSEGYSLVHTGAAMFHRYTCGHAVTKCRQGMYIHWRLEFMDTVEQCVPKPFHCVSALSQADLKHSTHAHRLCGSFFLHQFLLVH